MSRFIDFGEGKAMLVNNADWLMNLNLCPMLCLPSRSLLYMKISRLT